MKILTSTCLGVLIVFAAFVVTPAQNQPKMIRGGVLNGKAISLPKPEYPAEAKKAGIEGRVYVDVEVDETGNVISARAARINESVRNNSTDEAAPSAAELALLEAAESAAREARFSPTQLGGQPVKVSGRIVYNFVLGSTPSVINGGIINSKATNFPMPAYPPAAKAVRAAGTVAVKVTIDESGDVIEAMAVSGHPLLRGAAVQAAREAKFPPTLLSGQPVKVSGILTYEFIAPSVDSN